MFFSSFSNILYESKSAVDISKRVAFFGDLVSNDDFWFNYSLSHGELPEHVASDFYGDPNYHWVLLLINNIIDPLYDWYLTDTELSTFTESKYGGNINGTHHWEIDDILYNSDPGQNSVIVTNLEYEDKLNNSRRTIKVIRPEFIEQISHEYIELAEQA